MPGKKIAAYLRGEYGHFEDLDPKIITSLYAADRLMQIEEIETLRQKNDVVIFDRSVCANLIFTPAYAKTKTEKKDLLNFIKTLEYKINGFPRESLIIFLDASPEARKKIHNAKSRIADIHEINENYLTNVRENALNFCKKDFRWTRIKVDNNGNLRKKEAIAKDILHLVLERLQKKKN